MLDINFYKPNHPLLSQYIEGYYFIKGSTEKSGFSYYTFPNNYFIVSVIENAALSQIPNEAICKPSTPPTFFSGLTCRYIQPIRIQYQGEINELTVYFKPLGLSAFMSNFTSPLSNDRFAPFVPFADFQEKMLQVLQAPNRSEQIHLLEQYWLAKQTNVIPMLWSNMLSLMSAGKQIGQIANELGISRQYLHQLCCKHLGKTPAEFRNIERFRKSIQLMGSTKNLTELGFANSFYDQSHFIKSFKLFTLHSPKNFFKGIDVQQENLWLYLS